MGSLSTCRASRADTRRFVFVLWVVMGAFPAAGFVPEARGQVSYEGQPIDYFGQKTEDPVARLQQRIDSGEVQLKRDGSTGYLGSLLDLLDVPRSSQALVFSKTSFQLRRISPRSPRAVYFGDDVYVGWCQGGDVLEISAVDPEKGAIFYTLDQTPAEKPKFERQTHDCLACHSSSLSSGVPGHIVRSVYPAPDGQPILRAGTYRTDHTSPLEERWGGWYVTGQHGAQQHLGNLVVRNADKAREVDKSKGSNVKDLSPWFDASGYLSEHSDIVGLLVLEHQAKAHNLITRASFLTRTALSDAKVMNEALGRPEGYQSSSTKSRIRNAAEPLVEYLLFCEEAGLGGEVKGTSSFAADFQARGVRDTKNRSLRDLDLKRRLFKYPLSYLVYSKPFHRLPQAAREQVYKRLAAVLTGSLSGEEAEKFRHLSSADRTAILEILRDTKSDLPSDWELP